MIKGPTVITGAGRGIGRTIASVVARDGGGISLWGRHRETLESTAELLSERGVPVDIQVVDVRDREGVFAAAIAAENALGPIHGVVNNAGIARPGPFDELSIDDWDELFVSNVRSVMLVTKALIPSLRRAGGGAIVNMASQVGRINQANNVAYGASKFAVVGFTQGLGAELAPEGIRVNAVAPGPVETEMMLSAQATRSIAEGISREEYRSNVLRRIPTGSFATVDDIAETVAFLLDDRAKSITSECILVTGGMTIF